ncbi:MAG: hypothetical protein WD876_01560 [Candidatus Pacearchaeota archaeon]
MIEATTIILFLAVFLAGIVLAYYFGYKTRAFRKDRQWQDNLCYS